MMKLKKELPHEIVLEILKRLPVKPLMRFKCVSKSWCSTIEHPDFVAMHLKHSSLNVANWYVYLMEWYFSHDHMGSLYPDKSLTEASRLEIKVPFVSPIGNYSVVGSCNGLICIAENPSHKIFLWNLFTRKHKAILSSPLDFVDMNDTHMILGFGYSDRINDYKVVRITYFPDKDGGYLGGLQPQVDVYSLSNDIWRIVEFNVGCELSNRSTVSFNGNLHWISMDVDEDRCWCYGSIITFGVADEIFDKMALPKTCFVSATCDRAYLAVANNSLVLLIDQGYPRGQLNDTCCIWVMTEYGLPESWTKLHTVNLKEGVSRFHGFTRSGELLVETCRYELVSWNPSGKPTRLLWTSGAFDLVTMVESLVSP